MKKVSIIKSMLMLCLLWAGVGNVSAETYVKWKLVDGTDVTLTNGDVVAIVDLTSGLAMSNDKDSSAPDAVAVELNYDKDRLTGEVPDKVQWTYSPSGDDGYQFAAGEKYLYADSKGLKVGSSSDNVFNFYTINGVDYLHIAVGGKDYLAGVEESMFSNSWKLKELKDDGQPDAAVVDSRIAIFKKVDDAQKILTLEFPANDYEINVAHNLQSSNIQTANFDPAVASDDAYNRDIEYSSSKPSVLYPVKLGDTNYAEDPHGDRLYLGNSGTTHFVARIQESDEYDKVVTYCTIRYNNTWEDYNNVKGTKRNPLSVSEAISLAKGETVDGVTLEEDRCYFITGKVNKVNSGLMAMFGDMGLDEMLGDDMDMEEMMGDMDDFDMSEMSEMMGGMDMSSMIPGLGSSEGMTYYISDDGTKDNRIKVTNGRGLVEKGEGNAVSFEKLDDLSPGDDVLVYGPLVVSEDNNMFSSLFNFNNSDEQQYEWAPTNLNDLNTDDVVLLVDKNKKIALDSNVKGTTVTIKKDKIADNVATGIQWTLTKNDGTLTFTMDNTPLSVTRNLELTVGPGQSSEFTYHDGLLGIEYSNGSRYCIKWEEANGGYSAVFENIESASDNTEADFTFYKRVEKTEEDNRTVKVDELNYLHELTKTLVVTNQSLYEDYTKTLADDQSFFYTLNQTPAGDIQPAAIKTSDEEIAKWVYTDESQTDSVFTAMAAGKAKITVKVKVIVTPAQGDDKEKSYTMKRKFQLEVKQRAKDPEGKNVGEYVLVEDDNALEDGTRLLIVGTRTKDDKTTHYAQGKDNSMMGGGKGAKTVTISTNDAGKECIPFADVPENTQEIILEKEGNVWYLNVGQDENGDNLYLYASDSSEDEDPEEENTSGFNFDSLMEMFSPSSGLKVATKEVAGDSCQAVISIDDNIATIKFPTTEGKNNTIMLASSFDMDSMMNMFGGNEEEDPDPNTEEQGGEASTGMNFDFFMASFNTKKANDEKGIKPRIFAFVQFDEYPISIGDAEWYTFVSDYDVIKPENIEAYVVTAVTPDDIQSFATLKEVNQLKGGEPYLLHGTKDTYTMERAQEEVQGPEINLLEISDKTTAGVRGNTTVYVLSNKDKGVGFYRWVGGLLGAGRVYLSVNPVVAQGAGEYVNFEISTTDGILDVEAVDTDADAIYYNVQGQRVGQTRQKGLYISKGKKVVVK